MQNNAHRLAIGALMVLSSPSGDRLLVELGGPELMIVLIVVVVLFGPSRITGAARSLGEALHEFRAGQRSPVTDADAASRGDDPPS